MSEFVDCRGLSCPEPVMLARQALMQSPETCVTVIVSNAVARDNVSRAAKTMGWQVTVENDGEDFELNLFK
jgi:tRNA 2-thiouridine synthesizing protein A